MKSCKKQWTEREKRKPKSERRPLPQEPEQFEEMALNPSSMTAEKIEEYAEAANDQYNNNLASCPNCDRTFLPDRLEIHLRSCGKGHFSNPKKISEKKEEKKSKTAEGFYDRSRSKPKR